MKSWKLESWLQQCAWKWKSWQFYQQQYVRLADGILEVEALVGVVSATVRLEEKVLVAGVISATVRLEDEVFLAAGRSSFIFALDPFAAIVDGGVIDCTPKEAGST